jgi:hypothetical protein
VEGNIAFGAPHQVKKCKGNGKVSGRNEAIRQYVESYQGGIPHVAMAMRHEASPG